MVHVSTGIGFVPASATRSPCKTYQVLTEDVIRQRPDVEAPVAEQGTALLHVGDQVNAVPENAEWLWITTGIGFVRAKSVQALADAPATHPSTRRVHIVQSTDTLWSLAADY
jgi:hypothetical protein